MDSYGVDLNPRVRRDIDFENYLRALFLIHQDELLLNAAADNTKRRNLIFLLGDIADVFDNRGAQVNYCKKTRVFDFIQYTMRGYAKRFSV